MRIINSYDARPNELKVGDVMQCTVAVHIVQDPTKENGLGFRVYQGPYPNDNIQDGVVQGSRVYYAQEVIEKLFPVVMWAEIKGDNT